MSGTARRLDPFRQNPSLAVPFNAQGVRYDQSILRRRSIQLTLVP
jgi:hypothetical protein